MPMTHAPETGVRKRRQKTGVGFWRRFFTPVAKFLAPETKVDEQKVIKLSISLSVQLMLNRLNKLNNFNNLKYKQNLQLQQTKTTTTLIIDHSQISILITWSPDSVAKQNLFYPTPESGARNIQHQIVWQTRQKPTPVFWRWFLAPVSGACVIGIINYWVCISSDHKISNKFFMQNLFQLSLF